MALIFAAATLPSAKVSAHPHVWVTYAMTLLYSGGAIEGIEHVWTFDDAYTAMAVEGLDKNGDGKYDRQELAELAKVNMDGLKEFGYFTFAKLGKSDLKLGAPTESWLEHNNGMLSLHFHIPLEKPVLAEAEGFSVSVFDPSYFIAFEPEAKEAVKLAKAPGGCTAVMSDTANEQNAADAAKLGDAMAQQLGGDAVAVLGGYKTVSVRCTKS